MKQVLRTCNRSMKRKCPRCGFSNSITSSHQFVVTTKSVATQCSELDFVSSTSPEPMKSSWDSVARTTVPNYAGIKRKMMDIYEIQMKKSKMSLEEKLINNSVSNWFSPVSAPSEVSSSLNTTSGSLPSPVQIPTAPNTEALKFPSLPKLKPNLTLPFLGCGLQTIDYSAISSALTERGNSYQNHNLITNEMALDLSPVNRSTPLLIATTMLEAKRLSNPQRQSNKFICQGHPEYGVLNSFVTRHENRPSHSLSPPSVDVTSTTTTCAADCKIGSPSISQSDAVHVFHSAVADNCITVKDTWESESSVHEAVFRGDVARVDRECQRRNGDINTKDNNGETPLHMAIRMGNSEMTHVLLKYGANVAAKDRQGNNALHFIARAGSVLCMEAIKSHGISIPPKVTNALNDDGYAPFHLAVRSKRIDVMAHLINLGAQVNQPDGRSGRTALFHAVTLNFPEMALKLMDHGAKTNCADFSGTTPLAAAHGINKQMATLLMSKNSKLRNQQQ